MQNWKNKQKLISVIIPVYNVKLYLAESIESVIHQTLPCLEILLIDDGSTDGSGEICDRYSKVDQRIKVIHQKNRGLSAARNVGLNACKGEFVAFLDLDDVFCKNALSKMYNAMLMTDGDIIECKYVVRRENGKIDIDKNQRRGPGKTNSQKKELWLTIVMLFGCK